MRSSHISFALIVTTCMASNICASDEEIQCPINSLGLFKNGLAVVERTAHIDGPGTYVITEVPEAVHGTFWIVSDMNVHAHVTERETDVPLSEVHAGEVLSHLAGQTVTIHLKEKEFQSITGKVIPMTGNDGGRSWDRNYSATNRWNYYRGSSLQPNSDVTNSFLLERETGLTYIDSSMIAYMDIQDAPKTLTRKRPVLVLNVKSSDEAVSDSPSIHIWYLSKGISWAPAYRTYITNSDEATIQLQATVRNELEDFDDAEIEVISGFPNIEFGHVVSPMSPTTTLSDYFYQLSEENRRSSQGHVISQQMVSPARLSADDVDLSATPAGEGVDISYQPIGKYSMKEGDSITLTLASNTAAYKRLVEWIIPDGRDEHGRPRTHQKDDEDMAAWDAISFRNPFSFPMTTAPMMFVQDGRFLGQQTSAWSSVGEETTVQITKALNVRTMASETEEADEREYLSIAGRRYRKSKVSGQLIVSNHRNESISLLIRRRFSGDLIEADDNPTIKNREEGVYSVNKRNELTWSINLKPGEERTLNYTFSILVAR